MLFGYFSLAYHISFLSFLHGSLNTKMLSQRARGGRVVRWCWVNFQCRGVLLILIVVGQGPITLAIGAGGGCWTFFLSSIISPFLTFFLSSIISPFFLRLSGRRPGID